MKKSPEALEKIRLLRGKQQLYWERYLPAFVAIVPSFIIGIANYFIFTGDLIRSVVDNYISVLVSFAAVVFTVLTLIQSLENPSIAKIRAIAIDKHLVRYFKTLMLYYFATITVLLTYDITSLLKIEIGSARIYLSCLKWAFITYMGSLCWIATYHFGKLFIKVIY